MLVLRLHRFRDYCPRSETVQLSVCAPASVAVCLESDDIDFAIDPRRVTIRRLGRLLSSCSGIRLHRFRFYRLGIEIICRLRRSVADCSGVRLHRFRYCYPRSETIRRRGRPVAICSGIRPLRFRFCSVAVCLKSVNISFVTASQEGDNPSPGTLSGQLFWNPTSSISL